jgi:hypothetical protein
MIKKSILDELELLTDDHLHLVVAAKSDFYPAAHFRSAILCSLCASMTLYFIPWDFYDPIWYLYVQVPALVIGYFLAHLTGIKKILATNSEQKEEVYQMALETYHRLTPPSQKHRLLYLSLLEKRAEFVSLYDGDLKKEKDAMKSLMKAMRKLRPNELANILKTHLPNFRDDSTLQAPTLAPDLVLDEPLEIDTPTE